MTYLLDMSAFSALMKEDQRVRAWLSTLNEIDRVVICTIVAGRRRTEIQEKARILLEAMPAMQFPKAPLPSMPISS